MKEKITNIIMKKFADQNAFLNVKGNVSKPEYSVVISDYSQNYAVGMIDIVNSTKVATMLPRTQVGIYYELFLNSIAKVLARFGGITIKNVGDSLLFYFPETVHIDRKYGFMGCLECALALVDEHDKIKQRLKKERLPSMDYRISIDYGNVFVMTSNNNSIDLIGSPVNICAKINGQAPINGIIIGSDLYEITKKFSEYQFKKAKAFSVGLKPSYPIYTVRRMKI